MRHLAKEPQPHSGMPSLQPIAALMLAVSSRHQTGRHHVHRCRIQDHQIQIPILHPAGRRAGATPLQQGRVAGAIQHLAGVTQDHQAVAQVADQSAVEAVVVAAVAEAAAAGVAVAAEEEGNHQFI